MKLSIRPLAVVMLLALALGVTSCGSKAKKKDGQSGSNVESVGEDRSDYPLEVNGDSDGGKAGVLQSVFFSYDSSSLTSSARQALESNANFLKDNDDVEIQIEGHCDERGGVQYNLALGEKRAKAVKDYLVALGVASRRVTTISFGKERPISFGHDEDAWGRNRRANFVVTAK